MPETASVSASSKWKVLDVISVKQGPSTSTAFPPRDVSTVLATDILSVVPQLMGSLLPKFPLISFKIMELRTVST